MWTLKLQKEVLEMMTENNRRAFLGNIVGRLGALEPAKKKLLLETAAFGGGVTGLYLLTCLALVLCGVA